MNILLAGMGSVLLDNSISNHAFLVKELAVELENQGHKTFYLYNPGSNELDIGTSKSLYKHLRIPSKRLNIKNYANNEYTEYKNYSSEELFNIDKFNLALESLKFGHDITYLPKLRHHTIRMLETISRYDKKYSFDIFIFFGSSHLSKLLQIYAKKHNKKYFVLEEGYFRPYTATCDPVGVNFENSVPRERAYFEKIVVDYEKLKKYMLCPIKPVDLTDTLKNFALFKDYLKTHNYQKELSNFSKLFNAFIEKYSSIRVKNYYNYKQKIVVNNMIKNNRADRYVFVPFQLHKDTQTLLFSPIIKNSRDLVLCVLNALKLYNQKYNDELKVIFKPHPLQNTDLNYFEAEIREILASYANVEFLPNANTKELIKNSLAVITINSTVGIEALLELKPVITLGHAFYNIEGIVKHCPDTTLLPDLIHDAINQPLDIDLILKFLYYLRFHYFVELDFRAPNKETINNLINRILN